MFKIYLLFVTTLFSFVIAYKNVDGILELNAKDLTQLSSISRRIFVKYYVPWYTCHDSGVAIAKNFSTFISS